MRITLFKSSANSKKLDKTNYLEEVLTIEGYLRESTSISNPTILIESKEVTDIINIVDSDNNIIVDEDSNLLGFYLSNFLNCNYAYIQEFGRYYFITDRISYNNSLWSIPMHVDVLMSFKEAIGNTKAFVSRNEFTYDPFIKDELLPCQYDKEVTTSDLNLDVPLKNPLIIISYITDTLNTVFHEKVTPPTPLASSDLPNVYPTALGGKTSYSVAIISNYQLNQLMNYLLNDASLATYILNIITIPFSENKVRQGNYNIVDLILGNTNTGIQVAKLEIQTSKYILLGTLKRNATSFLDYEPYTRYQLYIPFLSWIELSADDILNNEIAIYYSILFTTGESQVYVYDITNNKLIFTSNCQCCFKVPISSTNNREAENARLSNYIGLGIGLTSSAIAIAGGVITENPIAIAGGALSAGSTLASFVNKENTNYSRASGSVSNGVSGLYLPYRLKIKSYKYKPKDYNADFFHLYGRPLNKIVKISSLTGFTQIENLDLIDLPDVTSDEYDEILSLLKSGIMI